MNIGCGLPPLSKLMVCEDLPEISLEDFLGSGHSATFNFKPISNLLGSITLRLSDGDMITTDGESIIIEYKQDGVKHTINKSWFE